MKLQELKSAQIITDPTEIGVMLERSLQSNPALGMSLTKSDDHGVIVRKSSSKLIARASTSLPAIPDVAGLQALAEARGFKWFEGMDQRVIPYFASDERVDGHGDIVVQNWNFDEYEDSPILMFCHEWGGLPIGGTLDWKVVDRQDAKYEGPALWLLPFYATEDQYDFADTVFRLAKARIMRAGSVGFYSRKIINITDQAEREALGLGPFGYILDDNVLVEFSPCAIGANAGALTLLSEAKQAGVLRAKDMNVLREINRNNLLREGQKSAWKTSDLQLRAYTRTLFPHEEIVAANDIEQPIVTFSRESTFAPCTKKTPKSIPLPVKKDVTTLEQKIDAFISLVTDYMQSTSASIEDIRSMVETMLPEDTAPTDAPPAEPTATQASLLTRIARAKS